MVEMNTDILPAGSSQNLAGLVFSDSCLTARYVLRTVSVGIRWKYLEILSNFPKICYEGAGSHFEAEKRVPPPSVS